MLASIQHATTGAPRIPMPLSGDGDICELLRRDHESVLAKVEIMRMESDSRRCLDLLRDVRRAWVIHALAEETVVYRNLESIEAALESRSRADERLVEDKLVEAFFERLGQSRPGTRKWHARLNVVKVIILQHVAAEHDDMFARLETHFDAGARKDMARRFASAKEKLTLLEEAKAPSV